MSWGLGDGPGEAVDSFVNGRGRSLVISDNMSTPSFARSRGVARLPWADAAQRFGTRPAIVSRCPTIAAAMRRPRRERIIFLRGEWVGHPGTAELDRVGIDLWQARGAPQKTGRRRCRRPIHSAALLEPPGRYGAGSMDKTHASKFDIRFPCAKTAPLLRRRRTGSTLTVCSNVSINPSRIRRMPRKARSGSRLCGPS